MKRMENKKAFTPLEKATNEVSGYHLIKFTVAFDHRRRIPLEIVKSLTGFTLLEITVVVFIVAVLAGLTLPRFQIVVERVRSAEGTNIMSVLYAAQKRHAMENNGTWIDGSNDPGNYLVDGDLDVTIPPPSNFDTPRILVPSDTSTTSVDPVASIDRNDSGTIIYTLSIDVNGHMHCADGTFTPYCSKMGYQP